MSSKGKGKGPFNNATRKGKSPGGVDSSPSTDNSVKIAAITNVDNKIARAAAEGIRATTKKQRKTSGKRGKNAAPEAADGIDPADAPSTGAKGSRRAKTGGPPTDTDILNSRARSLNKSKTAVSYAGVGVAVDGSGKKCAKKYKPNLFKKEFSKPKQLRASTGQAPVGNVAAPITMSAAAVDRAEEPEKPVDPIDVYGPEAMEKAAAKIQAAFRGLKARKEAKAKANKKPAEDPTIQEPSPDMQEGQEADLADG